MRKEAEVRAACKVPEVYLDCQVPSVQKNPKAMKEAEAQEERKAFEESQEKPVLWVHEDQKAWLAALAPQVSPDPWDRRESEDFRENEAFKGFRVLEALEVCREKKDQEAKKGWLVQRVRVVHRARMV